MIKSFFCVASMLVAVPAMGRTETSAERDMAVQGFDAVDLTASDDVRVVIGTRTGVVARGAPEAVNAITTEVRAGILRIGRKPGTYHDEGATITVTLPVLRAATIHGSGSISASAVSSPLFTGTVDGTGAMMIGSLRSGRVAINMAGSGSAVVHDITAQAIVIDNRGAGRVVVDGSARDVALDGYAAGSIDTSRVRGAHTTVNERGPGRISAASTGRARVMTTGGGLVTINGRLVCNSRTSDAAEIDCS